MVLDETKVNAFIGKAVDDWGSTLSTALVVIGEKAGLYQGLVDGGPQTPAELAARTGTVERYVREWLLNQAAGGYVEYDPHTQRFTLPPEHAAALQSIAGGFGLMLAATRAEPRIAQAFRNGGGLLWGEQDAGLFEGTERFFRPGYEQNLVSQWIPALDGVHAKLEQGAIVADIGCGHGASTIILAQAYPRSRFIGFDNHGPSIERARELAEEAGVSDRVTFQVAGASDVPAVEGGYDLIGYFDCLHDMTDPVGAARRAAETLAPGGTVLIVEPMAGEAVEDNLNPLGRLMAAASTLICTANSLAAGGPALGAQASEQKIREVLNAGGLSRVRRAAETPFNRVFEARR